MEIMQNIMLFLLIASSFVVIIAILLLPPREAGMGTSFGGDSDLTIFGRKKSHGAVALLEQITIYSSAVFMISAFIYNVLITH